MACSSGPIQTYAGDNTQVEVLFWEDDDQTIAHTFTVGATVLWIIVDEAGDFVQSFAGAVDSTTTNKLTGTDTNGAPAAGSYSLYAHVTDDGDLETVPSLPGSLALVVHAAIPTS